jgi:hypothetical protein
VNKNDNRASQATSCLERAWAILRDLHPEIPPAVMLVYSQQTRKPHQKGGVLRGHFARQTWRAPGPKRRHEIGVSPYLFNSPKDVLNVLLHEAAHATLFEQDPRGKVHLAGCTPDDPFYHRSEFRDLCTKWGLECKFRNKRYGFCDTAWPANRVNRTYRLALEVLKGLPLGANIDPAVHAQPQLFRLQCGCKRSLYARLAVAEEGGIMCTFCGREFKPVRCLPPTGQ